jgi:hypothetical protein
MDKLVAVEEVLAEMAETATNPSLVQKVVNIIRQALRALGFNLDTFTNGEILQLLQDSRKFVTGTEGVPIGGNVKFGAVFNSDAPIFYSQLASMVAGAPKQLNVASKEQWAAWIKSNAGKNQVKEEEIEYSGVLDFLNTTSGKISREDLLEFLNQEGVQVQEKIYAELSPEDKEKISTLKNKRTKLETQISILVTRARTKRNLIRELVDSIVKNNELEPSKVEELVDNFTIMNDDELHSVIYSSIIAKYANRVYDEKTAIYPPLFDYHFKPSEQSNFIKAKELADDVKKIDVKIRGIKTNDLTPLQTQINSIREKQEAPKYSSYVLGREFSTNYTELVLSLGPKKQNKQF